ncbi:MAG TPA: HEAT repeat domain-containing protein, partial [Tepidisphaeraceae bacterium]|nr:HEAT repeat domain-containing protein [Tepidisphaeraceae bacterium]
MSRDLIAAVLLFLFEIPGALLAQSAAIQTTQPAIQPATGEVDAVIGQLSADDWKTRQQAQERLVQIGEPAVDPLRRLVRDTQDEEVRTRAEAALRQIETNDRSGPTLVTLHLNNAPLPMVISELAKQAHAEIALWPPINRQQNLPSISVNVDRQPFWAVTREICEKAGLAPERMGTSRRVITLMQRDRDSWMKKPFTIEKGFLITAERAHRNHSIDYASQSTTNVFSIQLRILMDPKLWVLQRPNQIQVEEATDEKGNSLTLPSHNSRGMIVSDGWGPGWICDVIASLKYQPDIGKRIALLRGSARFVIVDKIDSWQIPDILNAKDVEHSMPIGKYTLREVKKAQEGQYQADILIEHNGIQVPHQNPLIDYGTVQQCIRLVDADGGTYASGGGNGSSIGGNRMLYQIRFLANN